MRILNIFSTLLLLLCFASSGNATNWWLAPDGSNSNAGTKASPYLNFTPILSSLGGSPFTDGDTIFMKADTFTDWVSIYIEEPLTNVVITAYDGDYAVLDGGGTKRFITGGRSYSDDVEIHKIHFKNMYSGTHGGALLSLVDAQDWKFEDVIFEKCSVAAGLNGGVFDLQAGEGEGGSGTGVDFNNCKFIDNYSGENGSVLYVYEAVNYVWGTFKNCVFYNNHAGGYGDVYFDNSGGGDVRFEHCTFANNKGNQSAVLDIQNGFAGVHYSIFHGNSSAKDLLVSSPSEADSLFRTIYQNISAANVTVVNSWGGVDPLFFNAATGDLRIVESSPAKDSAVGSTRSKDILGQAVVGDAHDLGAYETHCYTPISSINLDSIDVACFGDSTGSVIADVTGGEGSIFYAFDTVKNMASPLQSGSNATLSSRWTDWYHVIVQDQFGCDNSDSIFVNQPVAAISSNSTIYQVVQCHGDSSAQLKVDYTGGTSPYDIAWGTTNAAPDLKNTLNKTALADSLSNVPADSIFILVTDENGCKTYDTIETTNPSKLTGGATIYQNVQCYGESNAKLKIDITGGASPFDYAWGTSSGATDLRDTSNSALLSDTLLQVAADSIFIRVRDNNNCVFEDTLKTENPPQLNAVISTIYNPSCIGFTDGKQDVTVSGGSSPYTVSWGSTQGGNDRKGPTLLSANEDTVDNLGNGINWVEVIDNNGCQIETSSTLNDPSEPMMDPIVMDTADCWGDSTDITIGHSVIDSLFFYWLKKGDGATGDTLQFDKVGSYENRQLTKIPYDSIVMHVRDQNGCLYDSTIQIPKPSQIGVVFNTSDPSCVGYSNGKVEVTISGGISPYSAAWGTAEGLDNHASNTSLASNKDTISNLIVDNYWIKVTDNKGCEHNADTSLYEPSIPTRDPVVIDSAACWSDSSAVTVGYNTADSLFFSWLKKGDGVIGDTLQIDTATIFEDIQFNRLVDSTVLHVRNVHGCLYDTIIRFPSVPSNITSTISLVDAIKCNGDATGKIVVDVAGGTPHMSYYWGTMKDSSDIQILSNSMLNADTVSGQVADEVYLKLIDKNGCIKRDSFEITQPDLLVINNWDTLKKISCNNFYDGEVAVAVSGGTGAYHYEWSQTDYGVSNIRNVTRNESNDTILSLNHDTLYFKVSDSLNCQKLANFSLANPSDFSVDIGEDQTVCEGATVGFAGGIGQAGYSYSWHDGTLTAGISKIVNVTEKFKLEVTNQTGCMKADSAMVNVSEIDSFILNETICSTDSFQVDTIWFNTQGTHIVNLTQANGCDSVVTLHLTIDNFVTATLNADTNRICQYDTITFEAGMGAASYRFIIDGNEVQNSASEVFKDDSLNNGVSISVEVINGVCKDTSDQILITVDTLPIVSAGADFGFCPGDSVMLSGSGADSYIWDNGVVDGQNFMQLGSTMAYNLEGVDGNGCKATDQVIINELMLPYFTSFGDSKMCYGDSAKIGVYADAHLSVLWSNEETVDSFKTDSVADYSVIVTDTTGCMSYDTITFTYHPQVVMTLSNDTAFCTGGSATLSVQESFPTMQWSNGPMTQSITVSTSGAYELSVTDSVGCQLKETVNVTVHNLPVVEAGNDTSICEGDMVQFIATGANIYFWDFGVMNATSFDPDTMGVVKYRVEGIDANFCTALDSLYLTVNALHNPYIVPDRNLSHLCKDSIVIFTINGGHQFDYYVNDSLVRGSLLDTISSTEAKTGDSLYVMVRDTVTGCRVSTDTIGVVVFEGTDFSMTSDTFFCFGDSIELAVLNSGPYEHYQWSTGVDTQKIMVTTADTFIVNVVDTFGCGMMDTSIVTIKAQPMLFVSQPDSACLNDSILITATGGENYVWSDGIVNGVKFEADSVGVFLPKVIATDSFGCVDSAIITYKVHPLPTVTLVNDAVANTICKDSLITFTADGGINFGFFVNDTMVQNHSFTDSVISSTEANDGDRVYVRVRDKNLCSTHSDTITVNVESCISQCPIMVPDFNYTINSIAGTFIQNAAGPGTRYIWKVDGQIRKEGDSVLLLFAGKGFYDVCLTVYDDSTKCISEEVCKSIEIDSLGNGQSNGNTVVCDADFSYITYNDTVSFVNQSTGIFNQYRWEFGDGTFVMDTTEMHIYENAGFFQVCLYVFDTVSQCMDNKCEVIFITKPDTNIVSCNADFSYFIDLSTKHVQFTNRSEGDISQFAWTFGDGAYANDTNPEHTYQNYGLYPVRLFTYDDSTGCQSSSIQQVFIEDTTTFRCYAGFKYFIDSSNTVHFDNISTGTITNYFWNFGDGGMSRDTNPSHYYTPGIYEVVLNVMDTTQGGSCHMQVKEEIEVLLDSSVYCAADFVHFPVDSFGGVIFAGKPSGLYTETVFTLGNDTVISSLNVTHQFDTLGFHNVCFKVIDTVRGCLDEDCEKILAGPVDTSVALTCQANFNFYPDDLTANFNNLSIGAYKKAFWRFGDGMNTEDTSGTVSHTYATGGYYEVHLLVVDTNTDCFDVYSEVIAVVDDSTKRSENCLAGYNYFPADSGLVMFAADTKGDIDKYYWDWGDGTSPSLGKNPSHKFRKFGYHEVCLTVYSANGCSDTYCDVIGLGDLSKACHADFDFFALDDGEVRFANQSLGVNLSYRWDFGDSSVISQLKHPSHTYGIDSVYPACLTVTHDSGCVRTKCEAINIGNVPDERCLFDCVWPGDANGDLEANHYDVLPIGMYYGFDGPRRDSVSIVWEGKSAIDWSSFQRTGINNRAADCNGDGVINEDDVLAIANNFARSHYRQYRKRAADHDLIMEVVGDVEPGALITINVLAGDSQDVLSMYGVGFEVEFQDGDIDYNTVAVSWEETWLDEAGGAAVNTEWGGDNDADSDDLAIDDWGGDNDADSDDLTIDEWGGDNDADSDDLEIDDWLGDNDADSDDLWIDLDTNNANNLWLDDWMNGISDSVLITFDHLDSMNNLVMVSGSRKDRRNVEGGGKIATVTFMLRGDFNKDELTLNLFTNGGMMADGEDVEFGNDQLVAIVDYDGDELKENLDVFPNPSIDGLVQFYVDNRDAYELKVTSIRGEEVLSNSNVNGGLIQLELNDLQSGLYLITLEGKSYHYQGKVNILR